MDRDIDLVSVGRRIVGSVYREVSRIPYAERVPVVRDRGIDETKMIDRIAEDVVFRELEDTAKRRDLRFVLISEEQDENHEIGNGSLRVYTVVDPIDGSWNAVTNVPFYSTNLAFTEPTEKSGVTYGDFQVGVIGDMVTGTQYYAERGYYAYQYQQTQRQVLTSRETNPSDTRVILDSITALDREFCESVFLPIRLAFRDYGRMYGAGLELMTLVSPENMYPGYVGYVAMHQKNDNIVAGKIIIESAGGVGTDWDNSSLDGYAIDSRPDVIFSANGEIHSFMQGIVRSVKKSLRKGL
jgi:fructose-1,6-bisphosphatase/inositol monophosphatase family enzyme